jgi:hypothetical protein
MFIESNKMASYCKQIGIVSVLIANIILNEDTDNADLDLLAEKEGKN